MAKRRISARTGRSMRGAKSRTRALVAESKMHVVTNKQLRTAKRAKRIYEEDEIAPSLCAV